MVVNYKKSKVMMNSTNITMNGKSLEELSSLKYLRVILYKVGTCNSEIRKLIAAANWQEYGVAKSPFKQSADSAFGSYDYKSQGDDEEDIRTISIS